MIAIAFLIGIWMFVFGLLGIFAGFAARGTRSWWLSLIAGIIGVIGGLYFLTQPGEGSVVLVWVLGITRSSSVSSGSSVVLFASARLQRRALGPHLFSPLRP